MGSPRRREEEHIKPKVNINGLWHDPFEKRRQTAEFGLLLAWFASPVLVALSRCHAEGLEARVVGRDIPRLCADRMAAACGMERYAPEQACHPSVARAQSRTEF